MMPVFVAHVRLEGLPGLRGSLEAEEPGMRRLVLLEIAVARERPVEQQRILSLVEIARRLDGLRLRRAARGQRRRRQREASPTPRHHSDPSTTGRSAPRTLSSGSCQLPGRLRQLRHRRQAVHLAVAASRSSMVSGAIIRFSSRDLEVGRREGAEAGVPHRRAGQVDVDVVAAALGRAAAQGRDDPGAAR